ncbi:sensor histidine kinase [Azohydromonas aeria]|uniref:sensor histidine kinase n=1 Tax=Azohydromonas aeria TaxID=2590212 RepID=UPI0012F83473|nr:PAS domain-containing protein [Azohydromonas aeria]
MPDPASLPGHPPVPGACRQEDGAGAAGGADDAGNGRCQALIDALPNLAFESRADGCRQWSSAAWARYTGLGVQELAGAGWQQVVHPQDLLSDRPAWAQRLRAGAPYSTRRRLRRHDGQWRWHLFHVLPRLGAGGELTGWVGSATDVDEMVRAEEEREAALAELQERTRQRDQAQLRLDMALAAGRMGVWDWTPATGRSHWNRQMFELLGLVPSADGEVPTDLFFSHVHPGDRAALDAVLGRALAGSDAFEMDMRLVRADGGPCWVLGRGQVVRDARGAVERMVGVNLDITALKQAQAELAETVRAKDVLLYEVHHRVKNNLQIISSLLSLQLRSVRDADARRAITEAAARVGVMARLHLALYQSGGQHGALALAPWLRRLAQDTLALLDEGRPIVLDFQADDEALALGVDLAVPLSLALSELLTNAVKYAFPAGAGGTVRLHLRRQGEGLSVLVADDGVGLAPGFDPAASAGLGLRIVDALVRQVDGHIEVLQRRGGAAFRIGLPAPALD